MNRSWTKKKPRMSTWWGQCISSLCTLELRSLSNVFNFVKLFQQPNTRWLWMKYSTYNLCGCISIVESYRWDVKFMFCKRLPSSSWSQHCGERCIFLLKKTTRLCEFHPTQLYPMYQSICQLHDRRLAHNWDGHTDRNAEISWFNNIIATSSFPQPVNELRVVSCGTHQHYIHTSWTHRAIWSEHSWNSNQLCP